MSLRILSGLDLVRYPKTIGLMVQAMSSRRFQEDIARFPCFDLTYCGVEDGPCPYNGDISRCERGHALRDRTTTIADSGVFTKNGAPLSYEALYARYSLMQVERGIIIDRLGDMEATIESAREGYEEYRQGDYSFTLVGVAQGQNIEEYIECYSALKRIGYPEVAIGGLLTKKERSARYASSSKEKIKALVTGIRKKWPLDRCFVLGCYHPKRHAFLQSLGVDAADYKGWIFQYVRRYDDPIMHHQDRLNQTRFNIEKNILAQICSLPEPDEKTISVDRSIPCAVKGKRVYSAEPLFEQPERDTPRSIVIVTCGKKKREVESVPAADAYIGRSFLVKRRYAEVTGLPWFILSSKYGLLAPTESIDPRYDVEVKTKAESQALAKKVQHRLSALPVVSSAEIIHFLGPTAYAQALQMALPECVDIVHITAGLRQGEAEREILSRIEAALPLGH